ncbi:hypothetical protein [Pseudoalteromonas luteoviolacea]|uniref:Uncharacterized protein n=1 Tax=Pseudoalteromonas luteoviolacea H33 TaxID=1365251 RepID=A0A167CMQ3_9GAMM|nr:hypothetical protein [Pseudoalteromonas luteoviolacea]KZN47847.1 hypothetical protein N476_22750 [Pseudoalteromonas luteoviolacea H33]KZN74635.1 hypothetical protein N477_21645 [Pseudoalteromonas luteoviolacea H33-S]
MNKKVVIVISALAALIILYVFMPDDTVQPALVQIQKANKQVVVEKASDETIEPETEVAASAVDMSPFQLTSTQKAAKVIANNYRETLRYAPYSQPLTVNDVDRLEPNRFIPLTVPTSDMSGTISLSLNKYRFIYPEPIKLVLKGDAVTRAKVIVSIVDEQKILLEKSLAVSEAGAMIELAGKESFSGDLQLKVVADVAGDPIVIVAQAKYEQPSAKLIGLKHTEVNGSDLIMTLSMDVEDAGIYRVRANLYDGAQPLAHLVAKSKLSSGRQELQLKAHQSVLPDKSSDLRLMTFVVERMSSVPGERTRFGESEVTEIPLIDVDLSELSRDPYSPTTNERASLEFLEGMASQKNLQ